MFQVKRYILCFLPWLSTHLVYSKFGLGEKKIKSYCFTHESSSIVLSCTFQIQADLFHKFRWIVSDSDRLLCYTLLYKNYAKFA